VTHPVAEPAPKAVETRSTVETPAASRTSIFIG
jgi:hypothetical protein